MIIGVVIAMLIDERRKLRKQLDAAREESFHSDLENCRKDFAIQIIKGEHGRETALLQSEINGVKAQNNLLKAVIDVERNKRTEAENRCRNLST